MKPSYLGTLNAIVNGERRGFEFLSAWAEMSPSPDISSVLRTVALREAEHAAAFEKRMCELGYALREKSDANFAEKMKLARSGVSDREKFEKLGYDKEPDEGESDQLLQLLADKTIDSQTGALLGRFIAEERDSGRILREAYLSVKRRSERETVTTPEEDNSLTFGEVCTQLEKLARAVTDLQTSARRPRSAQLNLKKLTPEFQEGEL